MPQPTPYQRGFSFTDHATQNPETPLPGNKVDAELNAVQQTTQGVLDNLAIIQRDDGALANGIVGSDQLAPDLSFGLRSVSDWAPGTQYFQNDGVFFDGTLYRALIGHTSAADFAIDFASSRWSIVVDFQGFINLAAASADAASQSETNAAASETAAANSASNAGTSETNAAQSASDAAASAVSVNLPAPVANAFIQQANDLSGYINRTASEVVAILGALTSADIGVTVQGYDVNTLKADANNKLAAGFSVNPLALINSAGTVTPNLALRNIFTFTLTGNITLGNPSNLDNGGSWVIYLTQDSIGGHVVTFDTDYRLASGSFRTEPNTVNILYITSPGDGVYDVVITQRGS